MRFRRRRVVGSLLGVALVALMATSALAQETPQRDVVFGETHVHTSWSFDAYIFGNHITGPADAYKYALGEPIDHPLGYKIEITHPLDWMGVTDHSEYVGTIRLANDPNSPISKLPIAEKLKVRDAADIQRIYLWLTATMFDMKPVKELVSPEVAGTVWKDTVAIADEFNKPGKFTAFCSYEWTSTPDNRNLHRNVFFKDCKKVPEMPFSSLDSQAPEDLWAWMDTQRQAGNELLAIAHNANLSDGFMFPTEVDFKGWPIDAAWAEARMRNERLQEIKQIKGQSETTPILSPEDDFANFEVLNYLLGDPAGRIDHQHASYIREALRNGVGMQQARGYNPYKFGIVGGSDSHNTGVPYRQDNFYGGHARIDGDMRQRMAGHRFAGLDERLENPAGLTAVWAEENTRASLFESMQRKETYGTSGVRIKLRMFGGWGWGLEELKPLGRWESNAEWVKMGYRSGVPMGSDLPAPKGKAPSFAVYAVKDPDSGNLDRIQIIKGWAKNGQTFEKIYDIAWAGDRKPDPVTGKVPPIGSTVDIMKASYTNTIGATELKAVWTDPDFDPTLDAFYYARVLEIPTPRWTTIQAVQLGQVPPSVVAATVQERAWSSPIWHTPTAEARKSAAAGTTVADLKAKGAVALNDAQLKALIVGKIVSAKNTVTGQRFDVVYGSSGRRLIVRIDGKQPEPGDPFHPNDQMDLGAPAAYEIKDGQIVTTLDNTPFAVTVYKVGDKYVAARSNEFGYANYEVEQIEDSGVTTGVIPLPR
jgi:Protein of unknown function (DUF3604)